MNYNTLTGFHLATQLRMVYRFYLLLLSRVDMSTLDVRKERRTAFGGDAASLRGSTKQKHRGTVDMSTRSRIRLRDNVEIKRRGFYAAALRGSRGEK